MCSYATIYEQRNDLQMLAKQYLNYCKCNSLCTRVQYNGCFGSIVCKSCGHSVVGFIGLGDLIDKWNIYKLKMEDDK